MSSTTENSDDKKAMTKELKKSPEGRTVIGKLGKAYRANKGIDSLIKRKEDAEAKFLKQNKVYNKKLPEGETLSDGQKKQLADYDTKIKNKKKELVGVYDEYKEAMKTLPEIKTKKYSKEIKVLEKEILDMQIKIQEDPHAYPEKDISNYTEDDYLLAYSTAGETNAYEEAQKKLEKLKRKQAK